MSDIVIRKAEEKDTSLILEFINELAAYEKLSHEVKATEDSIRETIFGLNRYAEVLIAEYMGEPAGQALFFHNYSTFLAKPGIYLEDLFVKPHLRGKGIGKALLFKIIELAKERNCGRIEWAVLDWNEASINFYRSIGAKSLDDWMIFRMTEDKF